MPPHCHIYKMKNSRSNFSIESLISRANSAFATPTTTPIPEDLSLEKEGEANNGLDKAKDFNNYGNLYAQQLMQHHPLGGILSHLNLNFGLGLGVGYYPPHPHPHHPHFSFNSGLSVNVNLNGCQDHLRSHNDSPDSSGGRGRRERERCSSPDSPLAMTGGSKVTF